MLTNEEARVAFRYYFSLKLMEKLPSKCLCGHTMGDGSHLLVCKRVNAGQIAARDDAVRRIGAELNSYGVRGGQIRAARTGLIELGGRIVSGPT